MSEQQMFTLKVREKEVDLLAPEEFWINDEGAVVISATVLEGLAEQFGEVVPKPELVSAIPVNGLLNVAFECSGPNAKGAIHHAIGEASPATCTFKGSHYLFIMAHKRAISRWILKALGLKNCFSSDEFFVQSPSQGGASQHKETQNSSTPADADESISDEPPIELTSYVFPIGKYKGKTAPEVLSAERGWFSVFLKTWRPNQTPEQQLFYKVCRWIAVKEGLVNE